MKASSMNWSHDNIDGTVSYGEQVVAFTSPQGWRTALTHAAGDDPIRAVRSAVWRASNKATAEDIRRLASEELEQLTR